jgi:hypothetical protein
MRLSTDYRREIANLSRELPGEELKKILDFALFLKTKREGFSFRQVGDSAAYVRGLRTKEGKRVKSAKQFIEDLVEWQNSNC